MDLTLTDEQAAMAQVARDLVARWSTDRTSPRARWEAASEVGLDVALLGEEHGGLGLRLSDLLPTLRGLGADPAWPWASTLLVGPLLAGRLDLPPGPVGAAVLATTGRARAHRADLVAHVAVFADDAPDAVALIPAAEWTTRAPAALTGELVWAAAPDHIADRMVELPGAAGVLAAGRVGEAALLLGVADRALELAVAHATTRQQFGRPVGSFQAVKHLLAEARTELSFAHPLVLGSACAVETGRATAARDAAAALLVAADAAETAVRTAIQVHGAMGYTDELPLGLLLGAVRTSRQVWGGAPALAAVVDDALLDSAADIATPFDRAGSAIT